MFRRVRLRDGAVELLALRVQARARRAPEARRELGCAPPRALQPLADGPDADRPRVGRRDVRGEPGWRAFREVAGGWSVVSDGWSSGNQENNDAYCMSRRNLTRRSRIVEKSWGCEDCLVVMTCS